jgi:hypothetical protein
MAWHLLLINGWIFQIVEEEALESAKSNNLWCIHIAQNCWDLKQDSEIVNETSSHLDHSNHLDYYGINYNPYTKIQ